MEKGKEENMSSNKIHFTEHQLRILQLWEECATTKDIAAKLKISPHTVVTHLRRMRKKLGVNRTFEVYLFLKKEGKIRENS